MAEKRLKVPDRMGSELAIAQDTVALGRVRTRRTQTNVVGEGQRTLPPRQPGRLVEVTREGRRAEGSIQLKGSRSANTRT
jgi:hypothetical protein